GRFDRRIFLSLPDFKDRLKILEIYMKDKNNNVNLNKIAKASVGFSGAGLETLVNEAAINALRRNSALVEESDFYAVLNKVLLGKKKILSF
ncbi:ATP-dependent metallopeptidase FtsH/Yme1/Tma family protein, partial [Campylobacter jejuni]